MPVGARERAQAKGEIFVLDYTAVHRRCGVENIRDRYDPLRLPFVESRLYSV